MDTINESKKLFYLKLWTAFKNNYIIILLSGVLAAALMFIGVKLFHTPKYCSVATIYLLREMDSTTTDSTTGTASGTYPTNSDFSLGLNTVNDCDYFLKSHRVLDNVIAEVGGISYRDLVNSISINNPEYSRVLEVSVKTNSPKLSKKLANKICSIGCDKINEFLGFSLVKVYDGGTNSYVCNYISLKYYSAFSFCVMLAVYCIYAVVLLHDDKLHTNSEIEDALGVSIIGDIPNFNGTYYKKKYSNQLYGKE